MYEPGADTAMHRKVQERLACVQQQTVLYDTTVRLAADVLANTGGILYLMNTWSPPLQTQLLACAHH
jgi:hypothetical protein